MKVDRKGLGFRVGLSLFVLFWVDDWVGVRPLESLFPKLFRVVLNKQSLLLECHSDMGVVSWKVSMRRVFR